MPSQTYHREGVRASERAHPLARLYWSARLEARWLVAKNRYTMPLLALDPNIRKTRLVGADTELCIEGYPRSANTFSRECVRDANPELHLGRHVHMPIQILEAERRGIPAGVLLRDPVDAVVSRVPFGRGTVSPKRLLSLWIRFYEPLREPLAAGNAALLPFELVVADPSFVVRTLNERFGLLLAEPRSSAKALFERGGNRPWRKIYASEADRAEVVERVEALEATPEARALYQDLRAFGDQATPTRAG